MMPERLRSDQVSLSKSQKTKQLLSQKHNKIMAFTPTATFGQPFPFEMSFEAKLFSSSESVVVWLTRQQKAKIEMITKATGLCAKSRRAVDGGVFRVIKLIILNCAHARTQNARKRPETKRNAFRANSKARCSSRFSLSRFGQIMTNNSNS